MQSPFVAAALLCATPALAAPEIYQCRSDAGAERAVEVDIAGNRLAMHDGKALTALCGAGGKDCPRMIDGGYTYIGELGMILFLPETRIFQVRPWNEEKPTQFACRPGDAAARRRFAQ